MKTLAISLRNHQQVYVPALIQDRTARRAIYRCLFIACEQTPDQICGKARHTGYAGRTRRSPATYRLMIYDGGDAKTTIRGTFLPELFVLEQGVFRVYDVPLSSAA